MGMMQDNEARQDGVALQTNKKPARDMPYAMFQLMFVSVMLSIFAVTILVSQSFFYLSAVPVAFGLLTMVQAFNRRTTASVLPWLITTVLSTVVILAFFHQ